MTHEPWPPGPAGSGMASWNDPARPHGLAGAAPLPPTSGPQKAAPETGGRLNSATASIAVLVSAGFKTLAGSIVVDARNLPAVLERAAKAGVRQIWIGPRMTADLGLDVVALVEGRDYRGPVRIPGAQAADWLDSTSRAGWDRGPVAPWIELRRGETRIELAFPGWDPEGNPFAGARTAIELLQALDLFAAQLRIRYRWSPGATGLALMRAVHSGPGGLKLPEEGTPAPPSHDGAYDSTGPVGWMVEELPAAGWLHAWDLNGMFLAAASSAELGFGEAAHVMASADVLMASRAGYFQAWIRAPRKAEIPPPFRFDGKPHWYTAPAIELAYELDLPIKFGEAWIYPHAHRWLEPWYVRLRDARTALMAADGPTAALALAASKKVYAAALGRLAGSWMKPGDSAFRPDWRHVVIDRARANMHRHLRKVGRRPIAVDADLVVWSCSSSDPAAAAAELGLEVSTQLGKWKHEGAVHVDQARAAIAAGGKGRLSRRRALLAALEASSGPV